MHRTKSLRPPDPAPPFVRDTMRRAGLTDLTLPEDLIWTVPVTPLEEQLPQPTRAPPQRIPILKCGPASTRLVHPSSP